MAYTDGWTDRVSNEEDWGFGEQDHGFLNRVHGLMWQL